MVAGCSTVEHGNAVRASGGPPPGTVDVTLLDPGNYPTKPLAPMGAAGTPATGALLDAQRMADFVVGPWEVDPALAAAYPFAFSPGAMPLEIRRARCGPHRRRCSGRRTTQLRQRFRLRPPGGRSEAVVQYRAAHG